MSHHRVTVQTCKLLWHLIEKVFSFTKEFWIWREKLAQNIKDEHKATRFLFWKTTYLLFGLHFGRKMCRCILLRGTGISYFNLIKFYQTWTNVVIERLNFWKKSLDWIFTQSYAWNQHIFGRNLLKILRDHINIK